METENNLTYKQRITGGIIGITLLAAVAYAGPSIVDRIAENARVNRMRYENAQLKSTRLNIALKDAVNKSSGEDRIWATAEKRKFLDDLDIKTPIQEGQELIFRLEFPNPKTQGFLNFWYDTEAGVYLGTKLDNNGSLLTGSSANSGERIGSISVEKLRDYTRRQ